MPNELSSLIHFTSSPSTNILGAYAHSTHLYNLLQLFHTLYTLLLTQSFLANGGLLTVAELAFPSFSGCMKYL